MVELKREFLETLKEWKRTNNVGTSGKKVTLPHYMAMFLKELRHV